MAETPQRRQAEVPGKEASVEPTQRAAVGKQAHPVLLHRVELEEHRRRDDRSLAMRGQDDDIIGLVGQAADPGNEVGYCALAIRWRSERMGSSRPEGTDIPQRAELASFVPVLVGGAAEPDESASGDDDQGYAPADQPSGNAVFDRSAAAGEQVEQDATEQDEQDCDRKAAEDGSADLYGVGSGPGSSDCLGPPLCLSGWERSVRREPSPI